MKYFFLILALGMFVHSEFIQATISSQENHNDAQIEWVIIGAGPAGICVVGLLLDLGISESSITWIDQGFNVGRLGQFYSNVPGNTRTKFFIDFINCCKIFNQVQSPALEKLFAYEAEIEYPLHIIIDPLRDITNYLRTRVHSIQDSLQSLDFHDDLWHVGTIDHFISAKNVVLATGSHPKTLHYECNAIQIPLDTALDKTLLEKNLDPEDSVAVIGSAHSAILILKYLSELSVKRIINFYNKPIQYAIENPSGIINEFEGIKGMAGRWAAEVLEKNPPANLIRIFNQPKAVEAWLPICNKIICAIGYERNQLPSVNGVACSYDAYDGSSGIIAPRLFGIGIAFPEMVSDSNGKQYPGIGLNDFIEYAQRVLPEWIKKKSAHKFDAFKNLFVITSL